MFHIPSIMQTSGANKYIVNDKINDFIKLVFWELQKKQNDLESHLKEDIRFKNLWKTNTRYTSYQCAICFMFTISFNPQNNLEK